MPANIIQGKDAEFSLFVTDQNGHPIDLTGWTMVRVRMPKSSGYLEKVAPLTAPVNAVQTITFSATPDAGACRLQVGPLVSASLPYTANAAAVQAALQALTGLGDVTVSGSFGAGFVVTFAGGAGGRQWGLITVVSNTLTVSSVAVVGTVVTTVAGVPESGVDVVNASQGALKVELSEDDTTLLKVGTKLDMDLTVRIGPKDLNIPTIKGAINVNKNPFI